MIDYDKLKLAHELANKLAKHNKRAVYIQLEFYTYEEYAPKYKLTVFGISDEIYKTIDDLISNLQSLIEEHKPEPKYKAGEEVWHLNDEGIPKSFIIRKVDPDAREIIYLSDESGDWWLEEQLYPSREALIDAQIAYWVDERNKSNDVQFVAISYGEKQSAFNEIGSKSLSPEEKSLLLKVPYEDEAK